MPSSPFLLTSIPLPSIIMLYDISNRIIYFRKEDGMYAGKPAHDRVHVLYSSGSFKAGPWIWYHAAYSGALQGPHPHGARYPYGILTRMRKEGLISLDSEENRRKIYSITEAGKKALQEEYRRLQLMVADGRILEDEEK